jgi:hypothetical protein
MLSSFLEQIEMRVYLFGRKSYYIPVCWLAQKEAVMSVVSSLRITAYHATMQA